MLFLGHPFPILAHGIEKMSVGELAISVGLLVVSTGIAAALLLLVFLKPFLRVRRRWKEGRLTQSGKTTYLVVSVLVAACFLIVVWKFAWAVYYDIYQHRYEERLEASGRKPAGSVEYSWNRWRIFGRYGSDTLTLFVDDVLEQADPKKEVTASSRKTSPSATDWQPMTWDEKQKAFIATFKPDGEKMEFEFRLKSGWSSYQDEIIGYIPHNPMKDREGTKIAN